MTDASSTAFSTWEQNSRISGGVLWYHLLPDTLVQVEMQGAEPQTSCLQSTCSTPSHGPSPNWTTKLFLVPFNPISLCLTEQHRHRLHLVCHFHWKPPIRFFLGEQSLSDAIWTTYLISQSCSIRRAANKERTLNVRKQ